MSSSRTESLQSPSRCPGRTNRALFFTSFMDTTVSPTGLKEEQHFKCLSVTFVNGIVETNKYKFGQRCKAHQLCWRVIQLQGRCRVSSLYHSFLSGFTFHNYILYTFQNGTLVSAVLHTCLPLFTSSSPTMLHYTQLIWSPRSSPPFNSTLFNTWGTCRYDSTFPPSQTQQS